MCPAATQTLNGMHVAPRLRGLDDSPKGARWNLSTLTGAAHIRAEGLGSGRGGLLFCAIVESSCKPAGPILTRLTARERSGSHARRVSGPLVQAPLSYSGAAAPGSHVASIRGFSRGGGLDGNGRSGDQLAVHRKMRRIRLRGCGADWTVLD